MVRVATVVAALMAVTPLAASEKVTAPVSQRDLAAIREAVRRATREPLLYIDAIETAQPIRGSIPVRRFVHRPRDNGDVRFRRVKLFQRTDRVSVLTGVQRATSGGSYLLQKSGGRWKIISRGSWIQ
jgi:hypothetical protein